MWYHFIISLSIHIGNMSLHVLHIHTYDLLIPITNYIYDYRSNKIVTMVCIYATGRDIGGGYRRGWSQSRTVFVENYSDGTSTGSAVGNILKGVITVNIDVHIDYIHLSEPTS
jgi:hypothetical protein